MREIRMKRFEILLLSIFVCLILSLISAAYGIDILYTHLFYLPIILAGLWYYRKAVYVAIFLGLVHIMTTYFMVPGAFVAGTILRSAVFVVVACTVGLINEGRAEREEELKKERIFSDGIIATVPDSLLVLGKDMKIKTANHAFYLMFHTNQLRTIGHGIGEVFGGCGEGVIAKLSEIMVDKNKKEDEFNINDGERLFNIRARRISDAEELVIIADITERRRAEEELERRNKELRELVYITSHHLQESTRKMFTFSNMLLHSIGDKINRDSWENLQFVVDGANKMHALVNDLILYSKVIMHKGNKREQVDLNESIEELSNKELAPLLNATHGLIRVPEPLLPVQGDPKQVRLLMLNLITNGLKFHRAGTTPEVTIRSSRRDDSSVRVSVEDNGMGVSREYYDRIFGLFHRLPSSKDTDGTGVGLAICKKIVEQYGGEIGVESTPGCGSTFWFTMPGERWEMGDGR